jgi:hypothetical protein
MTIISLLKPILILTFIVGVGYAIYKTLGLDHDSDKFLISLESICQIDSISLEVSMMLRPPSGRLGAESAPILTKTYRRVLIQAEINRTYDPSRSSIVASIEPSDSIFYPCGKDTVCLKKPNGERFYYRIICH